MTNLRIKIFELEELLPEFIIDVYLGLCPAEAFIWAFIVYLIWRI